MRSSQVVDTITRKLVPFVLLFGFYLTSNGHISPGGGFQGGVVIATGVIMLGLSRGAIPGEVLFSGRLLASTEGAMFVAFVVVGFGALAFGLPMLADFLPAQYRVIARIPSFVFGLNLIIGVKVGAGITIICFHLLEADR
jgi:multicomponent Na+:H+ antiporter subunit B